MPFSQTCTLRLYGETPTFDPLYKSESSGKAAYLFTAMSDQISGWVREPIIPSKEILANVLASGHDDFTAMEDIIDNSIEALSSVSGEANYKPEIKVRISDSSIEILDNGCGMSNSQARNAMRLGAHMVQASVAGSTLDENDHFLFGSGRLGHFGVGGKAGACKLGNLLEYTTRQNGDSKVTVVRFCPSGGENKWEQEVMVREPIGEEVKLAHFTKVIISDLKCNTRKSFCYDSDDTTFFRLRARLFCTYFFLICRPGDKFDTDPESDPPSHRYGIWTLKRALKTHCPHFQHAEPCFSFHLHINGSNILKAIKPDASDDVEKNCPLNRILNCCYETMLDDADRVREENICDMYTPDSSTPPGPTPKAVAICMFDRYVDGVSSFEEQFEQNMMSRLALLDIHNTNLDSVRSDEAIERKNFRTFVFWRGRLLRHVDIHKTASNPKIPSFLQKRTKVGESYAPEGWPHIRKDVLEASERVITFVFFNEAFRPDPAKTTLQKDVQPFQSIFETDIYSQKDKHKMAQFYECIKYWKQHHDEEVKFEKNAGDSKPNFMDDEISVSLKLQLPNSFDKADFYRQLIIRPSSAVASKKKKSGKPQEIKVGLDQWAVVSDGVGGSREILKVRQFILLIDKRVKDEDSYWVRCFRPFAVNDSQVYHSVRASLVQSVATNSEIEELRSQIPAKLSIEIAYSDDFKKVYDNFNPIPASSSNSHNRTAHIVETVVAGTCPKLTIKLLNSQNAPPNIPIGPSKTMPYLLDLSAECFSIDREPKKSLEKCAPSGLQWTVDLGSQRHSDNIRKFFGKSGDIYITLNVLVNNSFITISEEHCTLLKNAQVPFLKNLDSVTIHFKVDAAPPKKLHFLLEPCHQPRLHPPTREYFDIICGEAFNILAGAVDEYLNIIEGKITKFKIFSKKICWSSNGKEVSASDIDFQIIPGSYHDEARCTRISRLIFKGRLPEDSHVNIDIGLEFTVKDQQLKLTGSLSKVRILPGLPHKIIASIAKINRSDPLQSSIRSARSEQRIVHEIHLLRNFCILDPEVKCDVLLIQAVDAWGNHIRDLKHFEVVVESSASESKLQTSFSPKGDAIIALASSSRDDNKIFRVDGSAMGIGWFNYSLQHHDRRKIRRIWGGRSSAVGLASMEANNFWYSSYVHNSRSARDQSVIGNLHLGMCCAFSRDALQDLDSKYKDFFYHKCLPSKPFPKPNHVVGRIMRIYKSIVDLDKVMFEVILFAPLDDPSQTDGPKYSDSSYPYLAASNISCVIEASDVFCSVHVVGIPSAPEALAHYNSTCTTKTGYNTDPVVPMGTLIVTHRLDNDLQLHAFGWCTHVLHSSCGPSDSRGQISLKFHTPRQFAPSLQFNLRAPVSDIKRLFLSELELDVSRMHSQHDRQSDSIRGLQDPLYQQGDYLSTLDHSQLRFLCNGRALPVHLNTPLHNFFGSMVNCEVAIWVSGPEAALTYESCHAGESLRFSYQDSITIWLKSIYLPNPSHDEQLQSQSKFPAKSPPSDLECDDPEHPSLICSVVKLAVIPSLVPTDIQFQVGGTYVEKRSFGREVGFVFPYDEKPTLTLRFLNECHEPTLAKPALCAGVLEIRRLYPNLASFDGHEPVLPEPIFIDIVGNTVEFDTNHQHYASIIDSKRKSKLTFTLRLNHVNSQIMSVLHLDTLEGNADNLDVAFDPKLPLFPGDNGTYFVTAEQPLKLVISTMDQTGRPSERGLGHVDEYGLEFSFSPVAKGRGKQSPLSNFFTNLKPIHLENEMHYVDIGEICDVSADLREFKFHISQLFLCGKPGKFVLKIRIYHRAGQKPDLCRAINLVIRPIESDCMIYANFPDAVVEGDLSEVPLQFVSVWRPKIFQRTSWDWTYKNGSDCGFLNNYSDGQVTLHLSNMSISMNQESLEGQVNLKLVSGQTLFMNDQPTSVYAIERKQKLRPSTYSVSFRPTSLGSRSVLRGAVRDILVSSPSKVSHCILLQWKTTADEWDAADADSLHEKIHRRYQAIKDLTLLQPQQEVLCFAGELTEFLLAAVIIDEYNSVIIANPDDYNATLHVQKGRSTATPHPVDVVTVDRLKLLSVKFSAPQGAAGHEYSCTVALSSKRSRNSEHNVSIRLCQLVIVPSTGFLKFESGPAGMQLIPSARPACYDIKNMKIRLKTHSSDHNSQFSNKELELFAMGTTAMNTIPVEKNGPGRFALRNSVCDTEFLKHSIGPVPHLTTKVRVTVCLQDVDHSSAVRKCFVDLIVPTALPGQAPLASSAQHAASSAEEAKRLAQQCLELQKTLFDEETKRQKYEHMKHLEQSIKTVEISSGDDASSLRQKVADIAGCYVADDTATLLLPVYYLHRTLNDSKMHLPQSSKHLLELPTDVELKHAGAMLAWKLSDLLQQDTFATVIIDAKHAATKMLPSQVHQAEQDAMRTLASKLGQMHFRFLPLCTIERVDENRRNLYEKFPLISAEEDFIIDPAKPQFFDRCQFKTLQCDSVLDRPIGFLDWAVNFLHFDPKFAALKFRQKFWLPLLQNVAVFDRSQHADEYKKYRENPDIGLPPITILTVFDDYFFHHDESTGISSYRRAPKVDSDELYRREWGLRVAPAVDRLSFIRREIASIDLVVESHKRRLLDSTRQLQALDPTGSLGWAVESLAGHSGGKAIRPHEAAAQPFKRTKFGESPGSFE